MLIIPNVQPGRSVVVALMNLLRPVLWKTVLRRLVNGKCHARLSIPPLHRCSQWALVLRKMVVSFSHLRIGPIGWHLTWHWSDCLITTCGTKHTVQIPSRSWEEFSQGSISKLTNGWHLDLCIFGILFHKGLCGCGRNFFWNISKAFAFGALFINMLCKSGPVSPTLTIRC